MYKSVTTEAGDIAYTDLGEGPVALFVHGVFMNSRLWRDVVAGVSDMRRCIAIDLPAHGRTSVPYGFDYSLPSLARVVAQLCDALDLGTVDLVANDTGGAVAQLFAVASPERLRTLTLTNCDCHDNLPPADFTQAVEFAKAGQLAPFVVQMAADPAIARMPFGLGSGFERPEDLTDEHVLDYLGSVGANEDAARELEKCVAAMDAADLMAAEPLLKKLDVPTLVAWGTGDNFFGVEWAYWLRDTIPGVREVVEVDGAKLFWPDERAADLVPLLRRFWEAEG